jgi:cellulose synthase/poly-beta-1,6-N-acetylglucosamine synthase-like glycosyltransferase
MSNKEIENIIFNNLYNDFYKKIKFKKTYKKNNVSIIIPVRGRVEFLPFLNESLKKSIEKSGKKINITVIEHSEKSTYKDICKKNNINYYFIESNGEYFNKSLCNNIGALLNKNSDFFLFHDLDCLVKEDFLINIFENINIKSSKSLQTFDKRRVLYLNELQTKEILEGQKVIGDFENNDFEEGLCCAPGGSILVEKDIFFSVGGYDPELFYGWSPEDLFFWDKISKFSKIDICDNPKNEIYHMFHEPQNKNMSEEKLELYRKIDDVIIDDIINIKKNILIEFL